MIWRSLKNILGVCLQKSSGTHTSACQGTPRNRLLIYGQKKMTRASWSASRTKDKEIIKNVLMSCYHKLIVLDDLFLEGKRDGRQSG